MHHTDRIDVNFPLTRKIPTQLFVINLQLYLKRVIADTIKLIDFQQLEHIIDLIYQYPTIDIYGSGNSLLAMSFQHKMMRISGDVNLRVLHGEQIFMSYNTNHDRIAMIISYSGETNEVIQIAQTLKEKKDPFNCFDFYWG